MVVVGIAACTAHALPTIDGCQIFPANNVWNVAVNTLPLHANSATFVTTIGASAPTHMDFGSGLYLGQPIGIPFVTVSGSQPKVPISFFYASESDAGPYPLPTNVPIEGGAADPTGDRHAIVLDRDTCKL